MNVTVTKTTTEQISKQKTDTHYASMIRLVLISDCVYYFLILSNQFLIEKSLVILTCETAFVIILIFSYHVMISCHMKVGTRV